MIFFGADAALSLSLEISLNRHTDLVTLSSIRFVILGWICLGLGIRLALQLCWQQSLLLQAMRLQQMI